MSVIGSFDRTLLFSELADPLIAGPTGTLSATTRRNTAVQNLTGNTGAVAATLGTLGKAAAASTAAGAGFSGGTGTIIKSECYKIGDMYTAIWHIDLTGLASSTTDLDIIGVSTTPAYYGRVLASECGATVHTVEITCLEAPAGGVTDIDWWSAPEATGVFDDAGGTVLTEKIMVTAGGAWTNGATKAAVLVPAANDYLYVIGGAGGTAGTYTAGKFKVEIKGYD